MNTKTQVTFNQHPLSIEQIINIANGNAQVLLDETPSFVQYINDGTDFLDRLLKQDGVIYGVTTGYGDSCINAVPLDLVDQLPKNLTRFHGCGSGEYFTDFQTRAIMAARLCSLSKGYSGVSYMLLKQINTFLNNDILPLIPQEGSVGASGDLTPLSYLAAALIGERKVRHNHRIYPAKQVLNTLNIKPLTLRPKEGLALMNGTAVMTALACQAYHRTAYLTKLTARCTAMASLALKGNAFHFDAKLFATKPHPGQAQIAKWIASDLDRTDTPGKTQRLQDRYSIRCAPHIIGVVQDSLDYFKTMIENELNSSNDNPIIDGQNGLTFHGGHFYGGHIASVMDTMKTQVANLADLLDRQLALMVDTKFNHGLPANLSLAKAPYQSIHHGFKAVQISASAWSAEALKLTMPASVFSRSTECHNQDKVSMGTIAARDCLRILTLTEQVCSAHLLACTQAITSRIKNKQLKKSQLSQAVAGMVVDILNDFEIVCEDRPLEEDLRLLTQHIQQQKWCLYP